jgi:hypothetical protein
MLKTENTVLFERASYDLNRYWLELDSLHNVDYDMFFSPFQKYTCQAGCKICYISKQLDESVKVMSKYAPVEITPEKEAQWQFWFDQFDEVGYSDDLKYTKDTFPVVYEWLKKNAHKFKYCMTDNAILRQHDILMNELTFDSLMDISISDHFLDTHPDMWNKVHTRLKELSSKYKIGQIKFIVTKGGAYSDSIINLRNWIDENNMFYLIHHNFTDEENLKHEVPKAFNYNDWTHCQEGRLFEIQKETVHLFDDRWFFSTQDATSRTSFWIMDETNNTSLDEFLVRIIEGKQNNYADMEQDLENRNLLSGQFKSYFKIPSTYTVNKDFNFIPYMLLSPKSRFVRGLQAQGWINTQYGLYKPGKEQVVPIIQPIKGE